MSSSVFGIGRDPCTSASVLFFIGTSNGGLGIRFDDLARLRVLDAMLSCVSWKSSEPIGCERVLVLLDKYYFTGFGVYFELRPGEGFC